MPATNIWPWIFTILSKKNQIFDWLFILYETISLIDRQYNLNMKFLDFIYDQPFHNG